MPNEADTRHDRASNSDRSSWSRIMGDWGVVPDADAPVNGAQDRPDHDTALARTHRLPHADGCHRRWCKVDDAATQREVGDSWGPALMPRGNGRESPFRNRQSQDWRDGAGKPVRFTAT